MNKQVDILKEQNDMLLKEIYALRKRHLEVLKTIGIDDTEFGTDLIRNEIECCDDPLKYRIMELEKENTYLRNSLYTLLKDV